MSYAIITPNDFTIGNDAQRIQQAVDQAARCGQPVVIPRINEHSQRRHLWMLDEAIRLPGQVTVQLDNCHIKLSDRCRDNFFRSANCGIGISDIQPLANIHLRGIGRVLLEGADRPRASGDGAKTLGEQSFGTDAGVPGEKQTGDWRNIGILLANVTDFSIENLRIKDAHCWAISLEYCSHGRLRDLDFDANGHKTIDGRQVRLLNQDGVDLRRGSHDILIENITGRTGDDLIALTALPGRSQAGELDSTQVSGPIPTDGIWNVIIRNVQGNACPHHIIRLLNNHGLKMHNILIDGVIDTAVAPEVCRAAVKIGENHPRYGGQTQLGETARIVISNVITRATHGVWVQTSLCDSIISHVMHYDQPSHAVTLSAGHEQLRNVRIVNVG